LRDTRAKLLQAAIRVFSEKGYRAASTRDIARRAKVNQVTLFRQFGGKARLYAAVIEHLFATSNLRAEVESRLKKPPELEGSHLIRVAIEAIANVMFQAPAFYKIVLYAVLQSDSRAIRIIWRDLDPLYALLARHIDHGIRNQRLRRVDAVAAARLVVAVAVHHYQVYELYRGKRLSGFQARDLSWHYADIIYHGLKTD
jgi:AcrR family transcriptional regulator